MQPAYSAYREDWLRWCFIALLRNFSERTGIVSQWDAGYFSDLYPMRQLSHCKHVVLYLYSLCTNYTNNVVVVYNLLLIN